MVCMGNKKKQGVTRRTLIAAGALASAGVFASTAFGAEGKSSARDGSGSADTVWDEQTEVLVVGCGGAGVTVAVAALDAGAKVLVIEKASVESDDGYGVTRSSMANCAIVHDVDGAVKYLDATSLGFVDEGIERAWAERGTTTTDWLDAHGLSYVLSDKYGADFKNFPGADSLQALTIMDPDADNVMFGGTYYMGTLIPYIREKGGEILVGTRAERLIRDDAGSVIGVEASHDGGSLRIHATKAVVMACGGFEGSPQLLFEYGRLYPMVGNAWPLNTGDGLRMCQAAGCDLWHMNNVCANGFGFQYPGYDEARVGMSMPTNGYVFVNKFGKRFMCESPTVAGGAFGHRSYLLFNAFDQTRTQIDGSFRDTPFYAVFDSSAMEAGPLFPESPFGGLVRVDPADGGLLGVTWSGDNSQELEQGYILKANSLEELADLINANSQGEGFAMEPSDLANTIGTYNGYCEQGADPDFGRPDKNDAGDDNLVAIDNPPYYAIRLVPTIYNTLGGPRKNECGQVLDPEGNVIPRLYAAGVFSESVGETYTVYGQNWAEILNYGRIIGENAAAETSLD